MSDVAFWCLYRSPGWLLCNNKREKFCSRNSVTPALNKQINKSWSQKPFNREIHISIRTGHVIISNNSNYQKSWSKNAVLVFFLKTHPVWRFWKCYCFYCQSIWDFISDSAFAEHLIKVCYFYVIIPRSFLQIATVKPTSTNYHYYSLIQNILNWVLDYINSSEYGSLNWVNWVKFTSELELDICYWFIYQSNLYTLPSPQNPLWVAHNNPMQ